MTDTLHARVTAVHRNLWQLDFDIPAVLSGRFSHEIVSPEAYPVVGDWVTATRSDNHSPALITAVDTRTGLLARKRPGDVRTDAVVEQPIAANIDIALLAMSLGEDFSVRRLERYLTLAWDSGATPVVVLTKSDREPASRVGRRVAEVEGVAFGIQIVVTSALDGNGLDSLREAIPPGATAVLLGSSGVGKSSLVNALAGHDVQAVTDVRDFDEKGRHTTTVRQLVELPWGAYLVDTPGLRELQLWADFDSLAGAFSDIDTIAKGCRFTDCTHDSEPGCAVQLAVARGELPHARLDSWHQLRRELAYLARKTDGAAARAERQKWKSIAKAQKALKRQRQQW